MAFLFDVFSRFPQTVFALQKLFLILFLQSLLILEIFLFAIHNFG